MPRFTPVLPGDIAIGELAREMTIRVVVVENHLLALKGISAELSQHPEIEVVAVLGNEGGTDDLLQLVHDKDPHLVILDLSLKVSCLDPFETIPALKERCPEVEIVVLIGHEDGILIRWLCSQRVMGCLFNDDERSESLGTVVRKASEGKLVYSQQIVERYFQLFELALTPRELDILYLAGEGLSNLAIAEHLSISRVSIRNHLSRIYAKLGVRQEARLSPRVCAINMARHLGITRTSIAGGQNSCLVDTNDVRAEAT
jgi:DNA-binding NarL/FixJ family response regulator